MSESSDDSEDRGARPTATEEAGPAGGGQGRKRKRRRSRGPGPEETTSGGDETRRSTLSTLTAGLFSHVDAREVPCKVDGCEQTWTWTAEEQIRAFGQPPPRRMCAEHVAQFHALGDKEVACANPGCDGTWTWTKSTRIAQLQKTGSASPPQRVCDACRKAERELSDTDVPCRIDGCTGVWRWSREAQLKHRAWLRRQAALQDAGGQPSSAEPEGEGEGHRSSRKRRRKRRRRAPGDGPPPRLCAGCRDKLASLVDREVQCKVHGCTRMVSVDREAQLRAWRGLGTDDPQVEAPLPKRMCEVCREFCRLHPDREIPCGRPGCEHSWTYKTGAQLQAFLAGRLEDPIRLCDTCSKGDFAREAEIPDAPPGTEVMPCIVSGCEGTWFHGSGMSIAAADDGDLPLDRMCNACRAERGAFPRGLPGVEGSDAPSSEASAEPPDATETTETNSATEASSSEDAASSSAG